MTKTVNPKHQAIWQLCDLSEFLCEWLYDIYDQAKHVTLRQSPRDAWDAGLAYGGMREHRHIRYDETFLMATLPSTPRETALVHPSRGITVHYLSYWNEIFRRSDVARTKVPVRYDPFDIGVIYAYVHQRWVECIGITHKMAHYRLSLYLMREPPSIPTHTPRSFISAHPPFTLFLPVTSLPRLSRILDLFCADLVHSRSALLVRAKDSEEIIIEIKP
jgi:hypothetical protein